MDDRRRPPAREDGEKILPEAPDRFGDFIYPEREERFVGIPLYDDEPPQKAPGSESRNQVAHNCSDGRTGQRGLSSPFPRDYRRRESRC